MEVEVHSRDIEKALRSLKKKLQLDGLFGELKKRRHYEKPSVKKKRKQLEAEKRRRKTLRRARPSGGARPSGYRVSTGTGATERSTGSQAASDRRTPVA